MIMVFSFRCFLCFSFCGQVLHEPYSKREEKFAGLCRKLGALNGQGYVKFSQDDCSYLILTMAFDTSWFSRIYDILLSAIEVPVILNN